MCLFNTCLRLSRYCIAFLEFKVTVTSRRSTHFLGGGGGDGRWRDKGAVEVKNLGKCHVTHVMNITIKHLFMFHNFFSFVWNIADTTNQSLYIQSINLSFYSVSDCTCFITIFLFLFLKFKGRWVAIPITNPRALDPLMVTQMSYCYGLASVVVQCPLSSSQELLGQSKSSFVYSICRIKRQ